MKKKTRKTPPAIPNDLDEWEVKAFEHVRKAKNHRHRCRTITMLLRLGIWRLQERGFFTTSPAPGPPKQAPASAIEACRKITRDLDEKELEAFDRVRKDLYHRNGLITARMLVRQGIWRLSERGFFEDPAPKASGSSGFIPALEPKVSGNIIPFPSHW